MPIQCQETLKEMVPVYLEGSKERGLSRHQVPVFVDERGRAQTYAQGSKVLSRLASADVKCPFILSEKDK